MNDKKKFLIVGLGLMGGSYAMGLAKKGHEVWAVDPLPEAVAYALEHKLIHDGGGEDQLPRFLAGADVVVLALYPGDIVPWIQTHRENLRRGAILTDLAGVKSRFVLEAQQLLSPWHEFIPCHPMAGREKSGVEYADDTIFHGANFLVTPTRYNTQTGVDFAYDLAKELGFGKVTQLSLAEHDEAIAYVSQLTHAIAVSLMNANDDDKLPDVTGDSFRDLTRIANMNESLWSELFLENAPVLLKEIDRFSAALQDLRARLAKGDKEGLEALFVQSTKRRKAFDKTK